MKDLRLLFDAFKYSTNRLFEKDEALKRVFSFSIFSFLSKQSKTATGFAPIAVIFVSRGRLVLFYGVLSVSL